MTDQPLFVETLSEALKEAVRACGGAKVVAAKLWPEKGVEAAQSRLLDCLNDARPDKLSPEQTLLILKLAREAGSHVAINFICGEAGYEQPKATDPEDERAKLQREFINAQKAMAQLANRMERAGMLRSAA